MACSFMLRCSTPIPFKKPLLSTSAYLEDHRRTYCDQKLKGLSISSHFRPMVLEKKKKLRSIRSRNALRNLELRRTMNTPTENNYLVVSSSGSENDCDSKDVDKNYNKCRRRLRPRPVSMTAPPPKPSRSSKPVADRKKKNLQLNETARLKYNLPQSITGTKNANRSSSSVSPSGWEAVRTIYQPSTPPQVLQCPICITRKFRSSSLLIFHLLCGHHLNLKDSDLKKLRYLICHKYDEISLSSAPQKFSRPFRLAKRISKHPARPSFLPQGTKNKVKAKATWFFSKARTEEGSYHCLKCNSEFREEDDFYSHVKYKHIWSPEEMHRMMECGSEINHSEFWCPECSERESRG